MSESHALGPLGWDDHFEGCFAPHARDGLEPARVARVDRGACTVLAAAGALRADVPPRGQPLAVGDFVAFCPATAAARATVRAILPRRSALTRAAAGLDSGQATVDQVLAANVDTVFLLSALDQRLGLRRIERYLALAWSSGASPAILLTKADLCPDPGPAVAAVESVAFGVPVLALSAVTGEGLEPVERLGGAGHTVALLGLSGAGKSTLANRLLGEQRLAVGAIRADGRGRNTTSHRELMQLPAGGVLIDTPGMRELALWGAQEGIERTFSDVESLAAECRFRDCSHQTEPGCAVRGAIASGSLDAERLESYRQLLRELRHLERKQDARARAEERRRWRSISLQSRQRRRS